MSDEGSAAGAGITRLVEEAAAKSDVIWVEVPRQGTYPVWFVWHDDADPRGTGAAAYVVSGPGEQTLPWLPDTVTLILRSKGTGARLISVHAAVTELSPGTPEWEIAAEILRAERLNAVGDVVERWRGQCVIHILRPHGRPVEQPGSYAAGTGARVVEPSVGTTARWRPWHWHGRPTDRRGTKGSGGPPG